MDLVTKFYSELAIFYLMYKLILFSTQNITFVTSIKMYVLQIRGAIPIDQYNKAKKGVLNFIIAIDDVVFPDWTSNWRRE